MSSALIENQQAATAADILKINPFVQVETQAFTDSKTTIAIRGFEPANGYLSGHAVDGIRVEFLDPISLEDKERVEVWSGLTSFLYGPTNVGGLINYVYKRPTETPLASMTIGDYGGLAGYVHGDFGGPIDKDGQFYYRLNIVGQDGNTEIDGQRVVREIVTGALDWHANENLKMGILLSHEYQDTIGVIPVWLAAVNPNGTLAYNYNTVPNPYKTFTDSFNTTPIETDKAEWNAVWKLNEIFTYRTAFYFSNNYYYSNIIATNQNIDNFGNYDRAEQRASGLDTMVFAGYSLFDASFNT